MSGGCAGGGCAGGGCAGGVEQVGMHVLCFLCICIKR